MSATCGTGFLTFRRNASTAWQCCFVLIFRWGGGEGGLRAWGLGFRGYGSGGLGALVEGCEAVSLPDSSQNFFEPPRSTSSCPTRLASPTWPCTQRCELFFLLVCVCVCKNVSTSLTYPATYTLHPNTKPCEPESPASHALMQPACG